MKILSKTFSFLFIFCLFLNIGCKKDKNKPVLGDDTCEVTYTIDGQNNASQPAVCVYLDGTLQMGLVGSNDIVIQLNELFGTTSIQAPSDDLIIIVGLKDGSLRLGIESGTMNVTEFSTNKIKGNFSGTFRDVLDFDMTGPTYELTNGKFEANF